MSHQKSIHTKRNDMLNVSTPWKFDKSPVNNYGISIGKESEPSSPILFSGANCYTSGVGVYKCLLGHGVGDLSSSILIPQIQNLDVPLEVRING